MIRDGFDDLLDRSLRQVEGLLLQVVSLKFADTAQLNDDSAFLCSDKMRDAGRNNDETPCRVAF